MAVLWRGLDYRTWGGGGHGFWLTSRRPWPSHRNIAQLPLEQLGTCGVVSPHRALKQRNRALGSLVSTERAYSVPKASEHQIVADRGDTESSIPRPVAAVASHGAKAWPEFILHYSPFILSCIRRFATDHDERMEIYVHVCRRLVDDDCRRIRHYRGMGDFGPCKFSTWLAAVVFNLAREWIRSSRGRRRLFRSLTDLGRTDRLVFQYYFWEGYSLVQIARLLQSKEHLNCGVVEVIDRLAAIERLLTRDHRWRLVTSLLRSARPASIDRPRTVAGEEISFEVPDDREDSSCHLGRDEAYGALRELIGTLPDEERLALRLRFERGLSAREIAIALGLNNYKRVYEIQGRALSRLSTGIRELGFEFLDFMDASKGSVLWPK